MTSHDVVHRVRRLLGIKRVGHSGTLDPMAEGVLSIYVGSATKFIDLLKNSYKSYDVWFEYGKQSDTFDKMGIVHNVPLPEISLSDFTQAALSFLGHQYQIPPMYSAIKVAGKPLYRYAREGIELERAARTIEITDLEVLEWDGRHGRIRLRCSKGTYIRSFVVDLAQRLGTVGIMTRLIRYENDFVPLDQCVYLAEVTAASVRPPDAFHPGPRVEISLSLLNRLIQGQDTVIPADETAERILLMHQRCFAGTAKLSPRGYIREKIYHDISPSE